MTLSDYILTRKTTTERLARQLRVSASAVSKWRAGTRLPKPPMIAKIRKLTKGKVTYSDWY